METVDDAMAFGGPVSAREVLDEFLASRSDRTLQAYQADLDEFARFLDMTATAALTHLLAGGSGAGRRLVLNYAVALRRRHRAPATIHRRLGTLRSVVRTAYDIGIIPWQLQLPDEDEIAVASERVPTSDNRHYFFPRHPGEVDRLDIQHFAFRETLRANYLAPVESPKRVLDVGSGTGQWGREMCQRFESAMVVSMDLVPWKHDQPLRHRYVQANVLHGLPFMSNRFDFVHQRLLVSGIPLNSWRASVGELARVTRPGGWVELVEVPWEIERAGPITQRLVVLARELAGLLGLDTDGVVYGSLDAYLREAGLVNVVRREISVPVGLWGGEVGSLMVTDFRAGTTRVFEALQARGRLTAEDAHLLIEQAQVEWHDGQQAYPFAIAFGQKPE